MGLFLLKYMDDNDIKNVICRTLNNLSGDYFCTGIIVKSPLYYHCFLSNAFRIKVKRLYILIAMCV